MKLNFSNESTTASNTTLKKSPWALFYDDAGVKFLSEPSQDRSWVDIDDPFKPGEKAGFSLTSGLLHLWSLSSQEAAADDLAQKGIIKNPRDDSGETFFTPAEFLMLHYGFDRDEAIKSVNEFVEKNSSSDFDSFGNKDGGFVKDVPKLQPRDVAELHAAQDLMRTPQGEHSDIVQSYCYEKGIDYQTLLDFGAGVRFDVGNDRGNDQILIPYYMNGKLVGVRVRGWSYKRALTGTMMTLFGLQQLDDSQSRTVIVVEGETDAFVTKQIVVANGYPEVPVIAIPTNLFKAEWKRLLKTFSRIIAIPQTDHASTKFAQTISATFGDKVEVVEIPFLQFDIGKDISHFLTRSENAAERLFLTLGLSKLYHEELPRIETLKELYASSLDERPFWINEILPKGALVILAGPPKSGKTFIGLELSLSMISGKPLFGDSTFSAEGGKKVLYIVEENSRYALINRFKTMGFTEDMNSNFYLMHLQNVRLDERESVDELRRDINSMQPDVVIFDPFANFHGQDENSSSGVQRVLQSITRMMKSLPNTTFVIVHHTGKNGETPRIRGSSAIWGRADLQLLVLPVEEDRATEVSLKVSGREVNPDVLDSIDLILDSGTLTHSVVQFAKLEDPEPFIPRVAKDRSEDKEQIMEVIRQKRDVQWSLNDLIEATNLKWYDINLAVDELAKEGKVEVQAGGRGQAKLIQYHSVKA